MMASQIAPQIRAVLREFAPNFKPKKGGATLDQLAGAIAVQFVLRGPSRRGTDATLKSLSAIIKKIANLADSIKSFQDDEKIALRDAGYCSGSNLMRELDLLNEYTLLARKNVAQEAHRPDRGRGRPQDEHAKKFTAYLLRIYEQITGTRPGRSNSAAGKPTGKFNKFAQEIFSAAGANPSIDHRVRKAREERFGVKY